MHVTHNSNRILLKRFFPPFFRQPQQQDSFMTGGTTNRTPNILSSSSSSNIHRRSFQDHSQTASQTATNHNHNIAYQPPISASLVANNSSGIFNNLLSFVQQLFQTQNLNPTEDSIRFISNLRSQYAGDDESRQLNLLTCSYRQAVAQANRESKPLLIYLHSPLHGEHVV